MQNFLRKTGISLAQAGVVSLGVMPNDYLAPYALIHAKDVVSPSGFCNFSMGTNAPNYDNWVAPQSLFFTDIPNGKFKLFNSGDPKSPLLKDEEVFLNITAAFDGTFDVDIYASGFKPNVGIGDVTSIITYAGGNVSIGTTNDGDYADVDATNAKITFPILEPGKWKIDCFFSLQIMGTMSNALGTRTAFRLTDGTNNSGSVQYGSTHSAVVASGTVLFIPMSVSGIFDFATSGNKTVKLQKKNIMTVNTLSRDLMADSDCPIIMIAQRLS